MLLYIIIIISLFEKRGIFIRLRHNPLARPALQEWEYFIDNPYNEKGKWHSAFTATQPLHLELGCGKGGFISAMASSTLQVNFIAVDIKSEVLFLAKQKTEEVYSTANVPMRNIIFTAQDIERIDDIFAPEDTVDTIYILFPNPWPKERHKKRRLTHTRQLIKYRTFLKNNGEIHFKTDDDELFEESLAYFEEADFTIEFCTRDAHSEKHLPLSVITEHEEMYAGQGIKIKYLLAVKNK